MTFYKELIIKFIRFWIKLSLVFQFTCNNTMLDRRIKEHFVMEIALEYKKQCKKTFRVLSNLIIVFL